MGAEEQQKTEAHEWECKECGYILRLEFGPLCCEGGVCNKCGNTVIYNGIKRDILKSTLGIKEGGLDTLNQKAKALKAPSVSKP